MAASLATTAGWRKSLSNTMLPTRMVVVAAAAAMMPTLVATWSRKWSGTRKMA